MKKLVLGSIALAGLSAVLIIKLNEPQIDRAMLEKSKRSKTPLHIFREDHPKSKVEQKNLKKQKVRWVKKSKKKLKKETKEVDQTAAFAAVKPVKTKTWKKTLSAKSAPNALKKAKPKKAERYNPWVTELSGEEANVKLAKKAKRKEKCQEEGCFEDRRHINLVGVVVETERLAHKTEGLVAGDVHIGDAKQLPALYVK